MPGFVLLVWKIKERKQADARMRQGPDFHKRKPTTGIDLKSKHRNPLWIMVTAIDIFIMVKFIQLNIQ